MTSCGHFWRASFEGISIALLLFFHWTRKASSPFTSVAPIIFSGSSPVSNGVCLSFASASVSSFLAFLGFGSLVVVVVDSSSECLSLVWFVDGSLVLEVGSLVLFVFSLDFTSHSDSDLRGAAGFSFFSSFLSSFFFELVVEPSSELLLKRRFFFSLTTGFFAASCFNFASLKTSIRIQIFNEFN